MERLQRLLMSLIDLVFPPRATELIVRSLDEHVLYGLLQPQTIGVLPVTALLPYHEPVVQACVVEAKYYGSRRAGHLLAYVLAQYLADELIDRHAYESRKVVLVPIPLSSQRREERGYNQSERIVRHANDLVTCGTLQPRALVRVRDTPPQTSLDGYARRRNLKRAFCALEPIDRSTLYVLIDDVVTTGSTFEDAARALREAGARHILAVALAH